MTTKQQEQKWFSEFIRQKLTKEEKEEFYSMIKDIVTRNEGSVWEQHKEEHKEKMTDILGYIANDIQDDEDINHPDYKDKTNYHEYSREECEYHNIDYDELHADDEEVVENETH